MKLRCFLIVSAAAAALFSGCARNHVLFMTKSNVGLDFDAKPPTLEITVSRKEVVVGPTFEDGQMPPVAASFKPRVGSGSGFANFFLGVDQTFEGGDAAMAMASLYASSKTPEPYERTNYNSALILTQPLRYTGFMRRVPGPGESRTFIFGTDTTLGLKAAWSGAGGQFPDTVKLGFNRKEFAWAPLFVASNAPAGTNESATYSVKMPSFLATIQGRIETGGQDGGISALQYFAAGETATLLALQPAVRKAMIERLDPRAAALEPGIMAQLKTENANVEKALEWLYGTESKPKTDNLTAFLTGSKFEGHSELLKDLSKDQLRTKLQTQWHLDFVTKLWNNVPHNP